MAEEDVLPTNVAFERMLLGAALRSPDALALVLQEVHVDDFYAKDNQKVFEALSLAAEQGAVDVPLLARALDRDRTLLSDARVLIDQMFAEAATFASLPTVIKDVVACSNARKLIEVGRALMVRAYNTDGDPVEVSKAFSDTDEEFRAVSDKVVPEGWDTLYDLAKNLGTPEAAVHVVPTGFPDLDRLLGGGFKPGQLVIIAARPGFGKTTLGMDITRHATIRCNIPGFFVSMEMSGRELAARAMSAEAGIALASVSDHRLMTEGDVIALGKALTNIEHAPLYVADDIENTLPVVRAWIMAMVRRREVRFVVVDYLGLFKDDGTKNPSREQVVGNISRSLKQLAKSLGIVIFLIAQINRGPEARTDKRPQLSDLRDSGQLEQDADVAMLIFRPEMYDPTTERLGEADVDVAKHRNGRTDVISLAFQGHYSRFVSMAPSHADPSFGS